MSSKILIVRPDAIGDVTLMIPMINTIASNMDAEIYTLQQPYTKPLLDNHPHVKEVLVRPKGSFLSFVKWIKQFKFDIVIFSYLDEKYAWAMKLAGIPIRIGDGNKILIRPLLTHPVKQNFRQLTTHETEQNLTLLTPILPNLKPNLKMDITVSKTNAKEILKKAGLNDEKLILIHPTTGGGNRAWKPDGYKNLIPLIEKKGYKVGITGFGKKDEEVAKKLGNTAINLVNKTTLDELKEIISLSEAVIGTDTGPTHMAAALGKPVVCISPTKFVKSLRWGPWQTPNRIVGHPEECKWVCNPYTCKRPDCLDAVNAKEVAEQLWDVLSNKSEENKNHWLKKSTTVLIYIQDKKAEKEALDWAKQLEKENIRYKVKYKTYNPLTLISDIIINDLNIIHIFAKKPKTTWFKLLRQLVAPNMYCPPIIVDTDKKAAKDAATFYMLEFER